MYFIKNLEINAKSAAKNLVEYNRNNLEEIKKKSSWY